MATSASALRPERRRDGQQWILDWVVKQSGREQNFEYDSRPLPADVKSHAMIPAAMERLGSHCEEMAREAEAHGHRQTARDLYFRAVQHYRYGQHVIYADDSDDKAYLYERLDTCFDRVIALAEGGSIERVEIPWEGRTFAGVFHRLPGERQRPTVLLLPGMDMTKESYPDPAANPFAARGMHVLVIDGPGQGSSNLRKIRVTADNYERAASAAMDYLLGRRDVDPRRIAVVGLSMGSYWAFRHAAIDARVAALATAAGCYGGKLEIFEKSSPRFKQIFMYMAGVHNEDEFDRMAADMNLEGYGSRVSCPALITAGQFDPLTPIEDTLRLFRDLRGPKELWVLENDFHSSHRAEGSPNLGGMSVIPMMIDWLADALSGKVARDLNRQVFVEQVAGAGPYSGRVAGFALRDLRARHVDASAT